MSRRGQEVDVESNDVAFAPAFVEKDVRRKFVSKVYLILSAQLAFTALCVVALLCTDESQEFAYDYWWILILSSILGMIIYFILVCVNCARRKFPLNVILVALLTLFQSISCAFIAARYSVTVVWLAFGSTSVLTISISVSARFCCDITGCLPVLMFAFLALIIFGLVSTIVSFFIYVPILHLVYSGLAVIFLCVYLLIITQMILGDRKYEIEEDEVVLAVIILYITIIDIFLHLLRLIGACFDE